jgi:hypothetical protein
MNKTFTRYAYTDSVKKAQARYGTRDSYKRMEQVGDLYRLTVGEAVFIRARNGFYRTTAGENGWPVAAKRDFSE